MVHDPMYRAEVRRVQEWQADRRFYSVPPKERTLHYWRCLLIYTDALDEVLRARAASQPSDTPALGDCVVCTEPCAPRTLVPRPGLRSHTSRKAQTCGPCFRWSAMSV
jgi:hypothetical protein